MNIDYMCKVHVYKHTQFRIFVCVQLWTIEIKDVIITYIKCLYGQGFVSFMYMFRNEIASQMEGFINILKKS